MTTHDEHQTNEGKLETLLGKVGANVAKIAGMVRGVYDRVADLIASTDAIYDIVSHNHGSYSAHDDLDYLADADD